MKTLLIAFTALMLAAPHTVVAQDDGNAEASAEEKVRREALKEELEQARRKVAEAAREIARIQRQLADAEVADIQFERLEAIKGVKGELSRMQAHIDEELVREMGMTRPRLGVLLGGKDDANEIVGVTPGTGADKAGIQTGDRLISINGKNVDASEHSSLRAAMDGIEAGDSVPVEIERAGERITLDVEVSSAARHFRVITHDTPGPPHAPEAPRIEREVIVVGDERHWIPEPPMPPLPTDLAGLGRHSDLISNHAGLEPYFGTAEGVVVLRIDADNPLKLEDGDVVLMIDGEAVSRPVDIGLGLLGRSGETVTLEVMRAGERVTIEAQLPESKAVSVHFQERHRGL